MGVIFCVDEKHNKINIYLEQSRKMHEKYGKLIIDHTGHDVKSLNLEL
jgi:hypothetical protein